MKIAFEGFIFNIPLMPILYIRIKQSILLLRRTWRLVARLGKYALSVLPVIILLPICALVLWLINADSVYHSYLDVVWDIRSTIIGSIIISYALIVFQGESHRKRQLKDLFHKYYYVDSALYAGIDECISNICIEKWNQYTYLIFQSEYSVRSYKQYLKIVKNKYHNNTLDKDKVECIRKAAQELKDTLNKRVVGLHFDKELMNISNDDLFCMIKDFEKLTQHIDQAALFSDNISVDSAIDWITKLVELSYDYIMILSIIWNQDNDINNKIRCKISQHDKYHNCLSFYMQMENSQDITL